MQTAPTASPEKAPRAGAADSERRLALPQAPCATQLKLAGFWAEPSSNSGRVYLSTRLDADDALPVNAFEQIYAQARSAIASHTWSRKWLVRPHFFCFLQATAWFPSAHVAAGVLSSDHAKGRECLSPGLTAAVASLSAPSVHAQDHSKVREQRRRLTILGADDGRWGGPIRARTVTSDGMRGVRSAGTPLSDQRVRSATSGIVHWREGFGIELAELARANAKLVQAEAEVARERASGGKGSCVKDFTCAVHTQPEIKEQLLQLSAGDDALRHSSSRRRTHSK